MHATTKWHLFSFVAESDTSRLIEAELLYRFPILNDSKLEQFMLEHLGVLLRHRWSLICNLVTTYTITDGPRMCVDARQRTLARTWHVRFSFFSCCCRTNIISVCFVFEAVLGRIDSLLLLLPLPSPFWASFQPFVGFSMIIICIIVSIA